MKRCIQGKNDSDGTNRQELYSVVFITFFLRGTIYFTAVQNYYGHSTL